MTYILYEKDSGRIISKSEVAPKVTTDQMRFDDVTMSGLSWDKIAIATTEDKIESDNVSNIIKQDIDYKTLIPVSLEDRVIALEEAIKLLQKP